MRQLCPGILMCAAMVFACSPGIASAQAEPSEVGDGEGTGIVYFVGTINRVDHGSPVFDLGSVHTMSERDVVAVFRPVDGYFQPVGTLVIEEAFGSYSVSRKARDFSPEPGDVVMLVRELSQLRPFQIHMNDVLAGRRIRARTNNAVSVPGRQETVTALMNYRAAHPQWVRNLGPDENAVYVVGELHGDSLAGQSSERLERLQNQINLLRKLHRDGTDAIAAAGEQWSGVMTILLGDTVRADAAARDNVVAEGSKATSGADVVRRIRRLVDSVLFDRPEEQRNTIASLLAERLKNPGGSDDLWFQAELPNTQFPKLADDDQILEDLRKMLRELRS
ncbi:MAG: hypothetical protein R3C19_08405 [Planctomycetaceae bacterium]